MHKFTNIVILLFNFYVICTEAARLKSNTSKAAKNANKRILGTQAVPVTDITEYPWLASIQNGDIDDATGIIVGKYWVLTRATEGHRYSQMAAAGSPINVVYGSIDVSSSNSANNKLRKVKGTGYKLHPNYNETDKSFPFILMRVCPGFESTQIYPTLGVETPPLAVGTTGDALGWYSDITQLKKLTLTVDTDTNCAAFSPSGTHGNVWQNADFCTINPGGTNNALCMSDRGGPFVVNGRVVGMNKFYACTGGAPDVFAELTPDIVSWIESEAAMTS